MGIFKSYDIRGIYPSELNEETAYKIGRAFVVSQQAKEIFVGKDARISSPAIFSALSKGITEQGAIVVDIGLCSTPMFYFALGFLKVKHGIMVTASHNPKEYNGFKLCKNTTVPIGGNTGIKEIEQLVEKNVFPAAKQKGKIIKKEFVDDYIKSMAFYVNQYIDSNRKLKIVVDAANGMGAYEFSLLFKKFEIEFIPLFCDVDFTFPNHEADPLKPKNLVDLQKSVIKHKADFGVALDGDADRCFFVDEIGQIISGDLTTALISRILLEKNTVKSSSSKNQKQTILYDLRSSHIVKETIEQQYGIPIMTPVGHANIKKIMREHNAIFAGELSGHFYYKDNYYAESSFITTALIMQLLSSSQNKLSEIAAPYRKYFHTGEINFIVKDKDSITKKIKDNFSHDETLSKTFELDGITMEFDNWWFNIRMSNTEPLLRLNLEATSRKLMEEKREIVVKMIG